MMRAQVARTSSRRTGSRRLSSSPIRALTPIANRGKEERGRAMAEGTGNGWVVRRSDPGLLGSGETGERRGRETRRGGLDPMVRKEKWEDIVEYLT
eukprot:scaffold160180_cov36-Tisochrysis_lutea.AAC.1